MGWHRFLVVLLLLLVGSAQGQDLESLRQSFEQTLEELNSKDQKKFTARWHPQAVSFFRNQPFALDLVEIQTETWNDIFAEIFSKTAQVAYTALDVNYRVAGTTGLVWGLTQLIVEPEGGSAPS